MVRRTNDDNGGQYELNVIMYNNDLIVTELWG